MGTASVKYEIIHEAVSQKNSKVTVKELCELAGVSRSGYYKWLRAEESRKARDEQDRKDFEAILRAYRHRGYQKGARGIHMRLLHENPPMRMNVKKIRRIMKKFGLLCPIRKANPCRRMMKAMKTGNVADNLLQREFENHGPGKVLLRACLKSPCTPSGQVFSHHTASIFLEIRQDSRAKFPCLVGKSLPIRHTWRF